MKIRRKEKSPQPNLDSQLPGYESDTLTTEPLGRGNTRSEDTSNKKKGQQDKVFCQVQGGIGKYFDNKKCIRLIKVHVYPTGLARVA